jgi:hypothetical protein
VDVEARRDGGRSEVGNQVGFEAEPRICCFGVVVEEVVWKLKRQYRGRNGASSNSLIETRKCVFRMVYPEEANCQWKGDIHKGIFGRYGFLVKRFDLGNDMIWI